MVGASMDKGVYFVYGCAILVSIVLVFYIWQSSHHIYKSTEPNKTANWCKYSRELWPRTKKVFTLLMVFVLFITSSIYNQFIVLFNKQLFVSVRIGSAVRLSLSGLATTRPLKLKLKHAMLPCLRLAHPCTKYYTLSMVVSSIYLWLQTFILA